MIDKTIIYIIVMIYGLINSFLIGYFIIKNKWQVAIGLAIVQTFIIGGAYFLTKII